MKKIKVAIIGAGYMAFEHAKSFASFEEFSIAGIYSRTREKASSLAKQFNAEVYSSIEELYKETKADLVILAVNELSVAGICKEIFQFPWLCFLEKPVGYNYEQACEISQLAFSNDHNPFVALNRRSYSSTRYALQQIAPDETPRLVSIMDQQNIEAVLKMGHSELVAYNCMYANSIHLIDYFNMFCRGDLLSVEPTMAWDKENPSYVIATLKFSSGDVGLYQAVWSGPGPWRVSVTSSNCRLEMSPLEKLTIPIAIESTGKFF